MAVSVQLILASERSGWRSVLIGVFLVNSTSSVLVVWTGVTLLAADWLTSGEEGLPRMSALLGVLYILALVSFFVGIMLVGWLHSRRIGLLSSTIGAVGLAAAGYALWLTT